MYSGSLYGTMSLVLMYGTIERLVFPRGPGTVITPDGDVHEESMTPDPDISALIILSVQGERSPGVRGYGFRSLPTDIEVWAAIAEVTVVLGLAAWAGWLRALSSSPTPRRLQPPWLRPQRPRLRRLLPTPAALGGAGVGMPGLVVALAGAAAPAAAASGALELPAPPAAAGPGLRWVRPLVVGAARPVWRQPPRWPSRRVAIADRWRDFRERTMLHSCASWQ
ncbi:unnamed protein product, partial [Prorocentrum cordatum]